MQPAPGDTVPSDESSRSNVAAQLGAGFATPILALGGGLVGAAIAAVPAYFIDEATFGAGNDDAGTLFYAITLGVGFIGFVIMSIIVARSFGKRLDTERLVTALFAIPIPASIVAWRVVPVFAERGGFENAGLIVGLAVFTLLAAALALAAAGRDVPAMGLIGVAGLVIVSGLAIGPLGEDRHDIAQFESKDTALALIDETALAQTLPGWSVDHYNVPSGFYHTLAVAELTTATGQNVDVSFYNRASSCDEEQRTCIELEPLADGSTVVVEMTSSTCDVETIDSIIVSRPTGHWAIAPVGVCPELDAVPDLADLELLLATIEPVDARTWVEAQS